MKKMSFPKLLFLLVTCVLILSLFPMTVFAAGETGADEDDAYDAYVVEEFTDEDGVLHKVLSDGTAGVKYPDGSSKIITAAGEVLTFDVDGTETLYHPDGWVFYEYPDGSMCTSYPDGTGQWMNTEGDFLSWETVAGERIVTRTNADGSGEKYFEGGEGSLVFDEDKADYYGTCTDSHGVIIEKSRETDDLTMRGPSGEFTFLFTTTYINGKHCEDITFTNSDGESMHIVDGVADIVFEDGSTMQLMEGVGVDYNGADGSFWFDDGQECDVYNAETGSYIRGNKAAGTFEMDWTENGVHQECYAGIMKISDLETGDYIIYDKDGIMETGNTKKNWYCKRHPDGTMEVVGVHWDDDAGGSDAAASSDGSALSLEDICGHYLQQGDGNTFYGDIMVQDGQLYCGIFGVSFDESTQTAIGHAADWDMVCVFYEKDGKIMYEREYTVYYATGETDHSLTTYVKE